MIQKKLSATSKEDPKLALLRAVWNFLLYLDAIYERTAGPKYYISRHSRRNHTEIGRYNADMF